MPKTESMTCLAKTQMFLAEIGCICKQFELDKRGEFIIEPRTGKFVKEQGSE